MTSRLLLLSSSSSRWYCRSLHHSNPNTSSSSRSLSLLSLSSFTTSSSSLSSLSSTTSSYGDRRHNKQMLPSPLLLSSNNVSYYKQIMNHHNHNTNNIRYLHLSPRERDHIELYQVGYIAQKRLSRGVKLNIPECIGLITMVMMEYIRDGNYTVLELMSIGQNLLGYNQVMTNVPALLEQIQIESTFPDGTKLLTIHTPICHDDGNLKLALYGSHIPIPDITIFHNRIDNNIDNNVIPGEVIVDDTNNNDIIINANRQYIELTVINTGDRPIQVGSHYAFIETNKALLFDRYLSIGYRLNIPSGTSIRFEPGESKRITLCTLGGNQRVITGNRIIYNALQYDNTRTITSLTENDKQIILQYCIDHGFQHQSEEGSMITKGNAYVIDRNTYNDMYGPTINDMIRLGDTNLLIRIEKDYCYYGDECKFGGGKSIREGMGQNTGTLSNVALDTVITNCVIIDPILGIIKADIGIKGTNIVGIGKAGNPDMMDNVSSNMIIGATTEVIAGEKLIITAGGIDTHIHWICPQQIDEAISSGITTMFGGGTGPSAGTCATTCTPSPYHIEQMLLSIDNYACNFGFSGKGNTSDPNVLYDVLQAGAAGFKLHEDWGTTPSSIEAALDFAEDHDIAITIHTDTLNESGYVDDSIAAMKGRTIHTYHTEGAGGGHAPDILKIVQEQYVLPSSTNPTRPFTINTIDEHLDMLMVCHHLHKSIPEDVAFAESRIRAETIAAEDILHDIGAISMISSDSQAMGRVGEVITRTWQTADKMKQQRGRLNDENPNTMDDNYRVKRYIAKYTINPAITHGMSHIVGSIEIGKIADLVLWKPCMFGTKPEMIIKGGMISYAQMGDPNASIPTPQPVMMRPMFGANTACNNSITFVSQAAIDNDIQNKYPLRKRIEAVKNCRNLTKSNMIYNNATPIMSIDPETFEVIADGQLLKCDPINRVPLGQRYFLF